MKYLFLLTVILFSCSKDNTPIQTKSEISFDMEGKHYEHTGDATTTNQYGVQARRHLGNVPVDNYYGFHGITNSSTDWIDIFIPTPNDTLKTLTYLAMGGSGLAINSEIYTHYQTGDYLQITITSYQGGIVNGIFSGQLSNRTSLNPLAFRQVPITNGIIKNVKVTY